MKVVLGGCTYVNQLFVVITQ